MKRRHLQLLILTIGLLTAATVASVFVASATRARILVDLLIGLAWPLVLLVAVFVFWPQIQALVSEMVTRTQRGASFQVGILSVSSLPEQAARIPSPGAAEPVSLENIALLHTSFLRPDKTREFDDGRTYYQFEVIVIAPEDVLRRVTSVQYELEDAWPPDRRVQLVADRSSRFKLKELANGTSIVNARVDLHGQDHPLLLNRFIDLRPNGPRL
jgi:pYEATS domain-containing protein involved in immunity